ncbi:cytochrome P450 2E1-like [Mytilus edulis]|uniref:cytochrome P450 2E1-like n=1 Tax=Mytilus edulis TaxID=6550 RepID=UPI0039EEDE33
MINIGILDWILSIFALLIIYVNLIYLKTSHSITLIIFECICYALGFARGYHFVSDLVVTILVFDFLVLWTNQQRPVALPPGPSPLPIIGNILHLGNGKDTVDVFRSLRKKYGDIFSLSLGPYWVVVVNGKDCLKEIFVKNGEFTSDRPPLYVMNLFQNKGIVSSNGANWKVQRSFTISKLRQFGFGKRSFESSIIEELKPFLNWIQSYNGQPFALDSILNASTVNSLMQIVVGKRFEYNDEKYCEFLKIINEIATSPALTGPVNFLPWLAKLPGDFLGIKADTVKFDKQIDYFKSEVEEHKKSFDQDNIRDFIDVYLKEMQIQDQNTHTMFKEDQLTCIVNDLISAGTETTATTIRWAIVLLLNNINVQNKMRKEIDVAVDPGRVPTLADRHNMPYSEAVILESLRFGNIGPLSFPHLVTEEFIYKDLYVIPKGSVVIPCLDSVAFDETWFPESNVFKPERFIDEEGKLCNQDKIATFSLGRRVCPGEALARMELFLYLTSMVHRFEFLPVEGEDPPSLEGTKSLANNPLPFKFRAIPREL